jgi:hypothetical protein
MTTFDPSDDLLRDLFERRAGLPLPADLRSTVLAATSAASQRRPWWRPVADAAHAARLLAVAALLLALIAIAVAVAGSQRTAPDDPDAFGPIQSTTMSGRSVEFRVPADLELKPALAEGAMRAWTEVGGEAYRRTEDGQAMPGSRGIVIASARGAVVHPCPMSDGGASRVDVRDDLAGFPADLEAVAGITLPLTPATVDGHPALRTHIDPARNRCEFGDFHVEGASGIGPGYVLLSLPSDMTFVDVDGGTLVVQVWAATEADLEAWRPLVAPMLETLRFSTP